MKQHTSGILVTGATGFIGRHLLARLATDKYRFVSGIRSGKGSRALPAGGTAVKFDLAGDDNDYDGLLRDIDVVIHLAGIAHRNGVSDEAYRQVNVDGTSRLAAAALQRGIRRFIFTSTVKVHGGVCDEGEVISETSAFAATDAYSRSKVEAEEALCEICSSGAMEYVILRPPLVYGPGVGANFLHLLKVVARGVPLPFAAVANRRSLIYVENMIDAIIQAMDAPEARNQSYLIKDSDMSTVELITELSSACGTRARLFPVPPRALKFMAELVRRGEMMDSLIGSLAVDDSKARADLAWTPTVDRESAVRRTVDWYKTQRRKL